MKTYKGPGKTLNFIAPSGGVVSGSPYIIGSMFCVAITSEDVDDSFAGLVEGVAGLTKAGGTTAAVGAAAYFDETSGLIETADSGTNCLLGSFAKAATSGNTNARVRLDGKAFGDGNSDLSAKADKVASAVNGNFAGLNAAGNLTDSGSKPADFVDDFTRLNALLAAADAAVDLNSQNITGVGTVDGRTLATDGAKLDLIEDLADVTDAANVLAVLVGQNAVANEFAAALDTVQDAETIVGGVLTPDGTGKLLLVTNEGGVDDDLETIAMTNLSSKIGSKLVLINVGGGDTTLKNGTGNIAPTISGGAADFSISAGYWVGLLWTGAAWDIDPSVVSGDVILLLLEETLTPDHVAVEDAGFSIPIVIRKELTAAVTTHVLVASLDYAIRVIDVEVKALSTPGGGGETVKVTDGSSDITDTMAAATANTKARAATIDETKCELAAAGTLEAVTSGAAVDVEVIIHAVRI